MLIIVFMKVASLPVDASYPSVSAVLRLVSCLSLKFQ